MILRSSLQLHTGIVLILSTYIGYIAWLWFSVSTKTQEGIITPKEWQRSQSDIIHAVGSSYVYTGSVYIQNSKFSEGDGYSSSSLLLGYL